jgi:hypothetical protein
VKAGTVKLGVRTTGWRFVGDSGWRVVVVTKRVRTRSNPKDLELLQRVAAVNQAAGPRDAERVLMAAFPGYQPQSLRHLVWRARHEAGLIPPP